MEGGGRHHPTVSHTSCFEKTRRCFPVYKHARRAGSRTSECLHRTNPPHRPRMSTPHTATIFPHPHAPFA